jgi:putative heme-binding domain-containing protein
VKTIRLIFTLIIFYSCQDPYTNQTHVEVPEGFKIEKLLAPTADSLGSWVSLTHVKENLFVSSDQYGQIYWLKMPEIGSKDSIQVTPLDFNHLGKAQGLLWSHNSLYVMMNDRNIQNSGLYRLFDSSQDGQLDSALFLQQLDGWGEHGPHGIQLGPDQLIYVIAGNHTDLPNNYTSTAHSPWAEDRMLKSMKDPNGHATDRQAPGGWIARTDSLGSFWEIYSSGYRNAYDIAFNEVGELFTFDSDMEWDLGLPWYRPVRVCHVTSGSEFGWRTGSAKWPKYYPDNLPGILEVGQGSPTGVVSAAASHFPPPFNKGLFVCDWSFGTMYHIELQSSGASYTATSSEFLNGVPLPLTDLTFGADGAMYFTTGGRRLESGLYRVWSDKKDQKKQKETPRKEVELRRLLDTYHDTSLVADYDLVWENIGNSDRYIAYGARIALENHGIEIWASRIQSDTEFNKKVAYALAVARSDNNLLQQQLFDLLSKVESKQLTPSEQLSILRAEALLMIRNNDLNTDALENQWLPIFPSKNQFINEELAALFSKTQQSIWVKKIMTLWSEIDEEHLKILISDSLAERSEMYGPAVKAMRNRTPSSYKIALTSALSHYKFGWNTDLRNEYFNGFNEFWDREGGNSYRGYLLKILSNALDHLPKGERPKFEKMSGYHVGQYGQNILANLPVPKGPGKNWKVEEVEDVMKNKKIIPNYINGQHMFEAALCQACHRIQNKGNNIGPDLTQLASRFTVKDMAHAIINPDAEISDQYMISEIHLNNDDRWFAKIIEETSDSLFVMLNPLTPEKVTKIHLSSIKEKKRTLQSQMFPALLNRLNEQEVVDLMTYLLAGGQDDISLYPQ